MRNLVITMMLVLASISLFAQQNKTHKPGPAPVSEAKRLYKALMHRQELEDNVSLEAIQEIGNEGWFEQHPSDRKCGQEMTCAAQLEAERAKISDEDLKAAAVKANHCSKDIHIGSSVYCVHILYGLPDEVNTDRWSKQLVYGPNMYVYLSNGYVTNIQRHYE